MTRGSRFNLYVGLSMALPLCALIATGCSKPEDASGGPPAGPPGAPMGGPGGSMGGPGGPGGMRGGGPGGPGGGGGGGPVAENASGAEIFQAKCGCHGPGGAGGKAPNLTKVGSRSNDDLYKIIHDGKEKMPAFGSQLKEAQIKKVVAYLKQLKPSQ